MKPLSSQSVGVICCSVGERSSLANALTFPRLAGFANADHEPLVYQQGD